MERFCPGRGKKRQADLFATVCIRAIYKMECEPMIGLKMSNMSCLLGFEKLNWRFGVQKKRGEARLAGFTAC
jgi:hypothetical protein